MNAEFRFAISRFRRVEQIADVKQAVKEYMQVAPNADLGEATPRENMRSAFFLIRSRVAAGHSIQTAIGDLERVNYSLMDC